MAQSAFIKWLLTGSLALLSVVAEAQITSNFASNADGWTAPGSSGGIVYSAVSGNPPGTGAVSASDAITAGPPIFWYFIAPAKFLANRCPSYNKNLGFDLSQASPGGTDTTHPDVVITGGGVTLTFNLPQAPAIAPGWRSFTVVLNESSGWKNTSGIAPTKDQFKSVLCNLTALQIRGKYNTGTLLSCTLDNITMGELTIGTAPVITSINPVKAVLGTSLTITGTNFHPTPASNVVFFGAVKATVQSASSSQLTVTVPAGASYGRITVMNAVTNLEAQSPQFFNPTYDNNLDFGGKIIACSMDHVFKINLDATAQKGYTNVADLDGDGLTDLFVVEINALKFSVFRNLGLMDDINAGSFAAKVSFAIGFGTKGGNVIADFDNDGKLDVAIGCASSVSGQSFIALYRNASTPGNLAFDPVQYIAGSSYSDGILHAADMDGDGRMEILSTFNNSCGGAGSYFSVFQNMSQPGDIEFCSFTDQDFGIFCQANFIATGDLNGDGKPDVALTTSLDNAVHLIQNNSTPGNIALGTPFALATIPSYDIAMADFDSDGKLDIAIKTSSPNEISIRRNVHTAGALAIASFSTSISVPTPFGSAGSIAVSDINGDGKPDLVSVDDVNLGILENRHITGPLAAASFGSGILYEGPQGSASNPTDPVIADFDRDNKPDVVFGTSTTPSQLAIYRNECFPRPIVNSLSTLTAVAGTSLILTGTLMNTGNQVPDVRFGPVRAAPLTSSNTSITATVPLGSGYAPTGITLHGLTGFSARPFSTTFPTSALSSATFTTGVDFLMGNNTGAMVVADFDRDGKIDIIAEDSSKLKIWKNKLVTPGDVIANTMFTQLPASYAGSGQVAGSDLDGDGFIDLITNGFLKRNNSGTTADPISFEANVTSNVTSANRYVTNHDFNLDGKMDLAYTNAGNIINAAENTSRKGPFTFFPFSTFQPVANFLPGGQVLGIDAGDFDGDGYDDIAYAVSSGTTINVHLNAAQEGPIVNTSFSNPFPFIVGTNPYGVVAVDVDGDGKLDLAVSHNSSAFITVLRNTSTPGALSFVRQDLPSLSFGIALKAADINGDGKPELVSIHALSGTSGSFSVFPNSSSSGSVSFASRLDFSLPNAPAGLALADVNLDQKPDVIIIRNGDFLSIYQNQLAIAQITITTPPSDRTVCVGANATFVTAATGAANITYRWQSGATATGPFSDLSDGAGYSGTGTNMLTVNTTGNFGTGRYRCRVNGDIANEVITNDVGLFITSGASCTTNDPPVIAPATESALIGGSTSLDLLALLSDPDDNLDLNSLIILIPPASGAPAFIDGNHVLFIDYEGLSFSGTDILTIEVCDLAGACSQKDIEVLVTSTVVVYNAVSNNGDGKNEKFIIKFIEDLPSTVNNHVSIYTRWGDEVFAVDNYNNTTRVFTGISSGGSELPSGTYFYKVVFISGEKSLTGFLELAK